MKLSHYLMPTLRDVPAEAEIESHKLMLRAGLMRKLASGVYSYLPMGLRALRKAEKIVREEMDAHGGQELLMSALLPREDYEASGRWEVFGEDMFRLKDRNGRDFCLGPTHKEIFTNAVKATVKSYKQLPVTLYQIQTKYRDERRPRFGVIRSREFLMKDAYSFDRDTDGLDISYKQMYDAYRCIFDRMDMDYLIVDADSGAMGGSGSQEFMVKSDIGEDTIVYCSCGYCANEEKAQSVADVWNGDAAELEMEKIPTPNAKTIEEVSAFLNTDPRQFAKTLLYQADDKFVAVMVRGDREVNETKLKNHLGCLELALAEADDVVRITGAPVGFAGPVGLSIEVIADEEVAAMKNMAVGANEADMHIKNVNMGRDFTPAHVGDFRNAVAGDKCPKCGKELSTCRGIEVGHIFKLGTKYSDALGCVYLDENGKEQVMVMGCYGIGVTRCLAGIIEQHCDEKGIIWPMSVAPFHAVVVPVSHKDADQMALAEDIYNRLKAAGVEAALDDRPERPGVKFNDADLIGFPIRITVGRKSGEGIVEYKLRAEAEAVELTIDEAIAKTAELVKAAQ